MNLPIPSDEQKRVLDVGLDALSISAGAGTGKTTTVAMVLASLVQNHHVQPERILGITFTNKAASELADRVGAFLATTQTPGREVEVHTYHGFAAQVLAEIGPLIGVDPRLRIITPTFSRQILSDVFFCASLQYLDITKGYLIDRIRQLNDRLGDHLVDRNQLASAAVPGDAVWSSRVEMLEIIDAYTSEKRRLGVVDYSDLVTLAVTVLKSYPELARDIRNRYDAMVLDEYQDTNPAQRVLLTTIFGDDFPVIAVGDEDQTIYEWRGASAENFHSFSEHFSSPGGHTPHLFELTMNRRSHQTILDIANTVRKNANPDAELLVTDNGASDSLVKAHWSDDAHAEANWVASQLADLNEEGVPWGEMAVLFRKNKDFASVVDSLTQQDIPFEVANIGGLLSVPEISEVRAWLTILERPDDSAALAQILFGSRYRLGFADIAPLTRWMADNEVTEPDSENLPAISLLEAIDHLDEINGIREDARNALEHFVAAYRRILTESQGRRLVEVCRLILDETRAWIDIEVLPKNRRLSARLNMNRLLDLADDWSPLEGRPSLSAFLAYLEAMEDEPAEELDAAHLSGEDAVTLVTVHRAKGLEWEVVAIPAATDGNFPSKSSGFPDPARFAEQLPTEFRIDNLYADMPDDPKKRRDYLRDKNELAEWRVAYVAVTRAKRVLLVSGAYWYGLPEPTKNAKAPSPLFELVAGHPHSESAPLPEPSPRPPILWRGADGPGPDPHFGQGWDGLLREAMSDSEVFAMAHRANPEVESEVTRLNQQLFDLSSIEVAEVDQSDERTISVTGLVTYAQCPKRYFWNEVEPLPRRLNRAALRGTEIHRRIELFQKGTVPFDDLDTAIYDSPDSAEGGIHGFDVFKESRFALRPAHSVETPFVLALNNGYRIRGRIDAIYRHPDGWEVVDFKSGRPNDEPARMTQLEAYAVAAPRCGLGPTDEEPMKVTFAYLGGGLTEQSTDATLAWRSQAADHLEELTDSIDKNHFNEQPGLWCNHCDFLRFCGPGSSFVAQG